jgi:hypothetical protein
MKGLATDLPESASAFAVGLQIEGFKREYGEKKFVAVKAPTAEHRLDTDRTERREQFAGMFDEFG